MRTDYAALAWFMSFQNLEGQVARWSELLQQYDMEVIHRAGKSHGNADALFRRPCSENCEHCEKIENKLQTVVRRLQLQGSMDNVTMATAQDKELSLIQKWMEEGKRSSWSTFSKYSGRVKNWALCIYCTQGTS